MATARETATQTAAFAALLGWLLPGAGHFYLGCRGFAVVFFLAISIPYWTGMALGGVLDSASVRTNPWLTLAAAGVGGYTAPAMLASRAIESRVLRESGLRAPPAAGAPGHARWLELRAPYMAFNPASDVAVIYIAAAGLLNVLLIIDVVSRALFGGLPTFHREILAAEAAASAPAAGDARARTEAQL